MSDNVTRMTRQTPQKAAAADPLRTALKKAIAAQALAVDAVDRVHQGVKATRLAAFAHLGTAWEISADGSKWQEARELLANPDAADLRLDLK